MTPEENAVLSHIGTLIYYGIVVLIVDCTLYGFYLLAECIAIYLFYKHGLKQLVQKILFIASTVTAITATWDFVNNCALNLIQIKVALMEPLEAGLQAQADAAQRAILPWYVMMIWPISINIITANGIVVWRAWSVCHENRTVRSALVTMGFVNAVMCLSDAITDTIIRSRGVKSGSSSLDTAQMFICLAVNIAATGLIILKARANPDMITDYLDQAKDRRAAFERVMLTLTESGVFLLIFQLLYAIFGRLNVTAAQFSPVNIAFDVIACMFNAITMLYSIAVIIMVITDRSALEKLFRLRATINITPSEKNGQTTKISTLRFADREASRQATTTTGLGSDIEAQEDDSNSDIIGHAIKEKTREVTFTQ